MHVWLAPTRAEQDRLLELCLDPVLEDFASPATTGFVDVAWSPVGVATNSRCVVQDACMHAFKPRREECDVMWSSPGEVGAMHRPTGHG
jgi:hypothetical protein